MLCGSLNFLLLCCILVWERALALREPPNASTRNLIWGLGFRGLEFRVDQTHTSCTTMKLLVVLDGP